MGSTVCTQAGSSRRRAWAGSGRLCRAVRAYGRAAQDRSSQAGDSIHMENHFHVQGTINSQTVRQIERGIGDSVARNRIDR